MKSNSSTPIDREAVLTALRHAVQMRNGQRITLHEFLEHPGMSRKEVFRHFARWEDVLQAAGFDFRPHNATIDTTLLLADWGAAARDLQRLPTRAEYAVRGKYSAGTLETRFDGWTKVPAAFQKFAKDQPQWADLQALIPSLKKETRSRPRQGGRWPISRWLSRGTRRRQMKNLPVYGAPLDFGGLRHAPVNEQGVVFLFGMMAERLGFLVEALRAGFPDCEAKRRIGPDAWQRVRIEFEYESRNFREHGHDVEACDLIVCWHHNWPGCPLEVIELKSEVLRPARRTGELHGLADDAHFAAILTGGNRCEAV